MASTGRPRAASHEGRQRAANTDHIAFFFLSVAVLSSSSLELIKLMDAQILHGINYPREGQFVHLGLFYLLLSGMLNDGPPRVFDDGLITVISAKLSEVMRLYGLFKCRLTLF